MVMIFNATFNNIYFLPISFIEHTHTIGHLPGLGQSSLTGTHTYDWSLTWLRIVVTNRNTHIRLVNSPGFHEYDISVLLRKYIMNSICYIISMVFLNCNYYTYIITWC
jgi:hypothetical protein